MAGESLSDYLHDRMMYEQERRAEEQCEEHRKFIEQNPVNGDIDLSPYPLLVV